MLVCREHDSDGAFPRDRENLFENADDKPRGRIQIIQQHHLVPSFACPALSLRDRSASGGRLGGRRPACHAMANIECSIVTRNALFLQESRHRIGEHLHQNVRPKSERGRAGLKHAQLELSVIETQLRLRGLLER
jgi:hypothetical protein